TLTLQIVELCESADAELDAEADAFDNLRVLEKNAPEVLEKATQDAATARTRLDAAAGKLTGLAATYSPAAIEPIASNSDQADDLLDFAEKHLATAAEALAAGERGAAAVAVHTAQSSLGQAAQLLDAIDGLEASLATAANDLGTVVADMNADLAAAKTLPA